VHVSLHWGRPDFEQRMATPHYRLVKDTRAVNLAEGDCGAILPRPVDARVVVRRDSWAKRAQENRTPAFDHFPLGFAQFWVLAQLAPRTCACASTAGQDTQDTNQLRRTCACIETKGIGDALPPAFDQTNAVPSSTPAQLGCMYLARNASK
jgi:hypothetical protein